MSRLRKIVIPAVAAGLITAGAPFFYMMELEKPIRIPNHSLSYRNGQKRAEIKNQEPINTKKFFNKEPGGANGGITEEEQNKIYSKLYRVLTSCNEQGDYRAFIDELSKIRLRYNDYTFMPHGHYKFEPSYDLLEAYLADDKLKMLEMALTRGLFPESAVFCNELGIPEEVVRALYEKGGEFQDEKIEKPYSMENLSSIAYDLSYGYFNTALGAANRDEKGDLPKQLKDRLADFIINYSDREDISLIERLADIVEIDTKRPEIREAIINSINNRESFYSPEDINGLERLVAGYKLLDMEDAAKEATAFYFDRFFNEKIDKVINSGEYGGNVYDKLWKFKAYLGEDKYNFWSNYLKGLDEYLK